MDRCPTCGVRWSDGVTCRRCGTELASVLAVERAARAQAGRAADALRRGDAEAALAAARHSCWLHRTPEGLRLLALAAVVCGRYDEALRAWQRESAGGEL